VEVVAVLRLLWRRKLLVLVGAVLAVGVAYKFGMSPTPPSGFATTQVLLDTTRSQLVDDAAEGTDSLPWRATLAAQMLGSDANRRSIATATGIPLTSLDVTDFELTIPTIPASLPKAAVQGAYASSAPYSVLAHTDNTVPLITVSGSAPDRAAAIRLTEAAVKTLQASVKTTQSKDLLGLDVQTTSPIDSVEIPAGTGRKKMVVFAMVLFLMWVAALTLVPAILSAIRLGLGDAETAR
jgi:hypothetical protein